MKRLSTILTTLAVLLLCLFLLPTEAEAAEIASGTCGDNLTWVLDDSGTLTISGTGAMTNYNFSSNAPWSDAVTPIKSVTIENGVTSIGKLAFTDCAGLISVAIPNSVTSIGYHAFAGCNGLTSVTIPNSVTSIGISAFGYCTGLTSVTIPDSVTSIGHSAFGYCTGLTSVTIGNGVTSIDNYAFYGCNGLTSVTIGNGVTSIGKRTFYGCDNIKDVYYGGTRTQWNTIRIGASNYSLTNAMLHTVQSVMAQGACGENLTWQLDEDGTLTIFGTGEMDNYGNTSTAPWNGEGMSIKCVIIGQGVTSIGDNAFYGFHSMTSITIPNSITSIGNNAFYNCSGLPFITIPNSVASIGNSAFYGCDGLKDLCYIGTEAQWDAIIMGENNENLANATCHTVKTIVARGTCGDNLTWQLDEGGTLTIFGIGAMDNYGNNGYSSTTPWSGDDTSINCVIIGQGVTSIGANAFWSFDSMTSITIPNSITSIGNDAFFGCDGLTSVTIGNGVTSIGDSAFSCCTGLTSITILDSVTSIGDCAFSGCDSLTSITIGSSVASMGEKPFSFCTSLTGIWVDKDNSNYSSDEMGVLFDKSKQYLFQYPQGLVGHYNIPDSIAHIGDGAFSDCAGLTSVTIPNSITQIITSAFSNCDGLTSITIPNSVTSIWNNAFGGCNNLTSVTIGNGTTRISENAFSHCPKLAGIWVDKDNSQYSSDENGVLFDKAKTSIVIFPQGFVGKYTIPNSVTSIGNSLFSSCGGLTSITIPDSVTSIGKYAFYNCDGLTSVTIPDSVTSIGTYAFENCWRLKSVVIGSKMDTINAYAFSGCSKLNHVLCTGTQDDWEWIIIDDGNDYLLNATRHYNCTGDEITERGCTICDPTLLPEATLNVYRANVRLQELMKMGFYFTMDTDETVLEIGSIVWTADEYANETAFDINFTKGTKYLATTHTNSDGSYYYSVETGGIPAQEIDTLLYIIPYVKTEDGYAYGTAKSNSILNVCKYQYENDTDEVKEIIADVLNYATAARNYFVAKGELDVPAEAFNDILNESAKVLAWSDDLLVSRASVAETTSEYAPTAYQIYVYIQDALKIEFVFADTSVAGIMYWKGTDYTVQDVHDGSTKTGETAISTQGKYVVGSIEGLNAYNIYEDYYIRGYNADGDLSKAYTTSIAAYLTCIIQENSEPADAEAEALVELCKAMLIYGKNAIENDSVNKN